MTDRPGAAASFDLALARMIDHTNLKPDAVPADIERLCAEAAQYHFASVCVNPSHVALCAGLLAGTDVRVCTVVGFPLGATTTRAKVFETEEAASLGAREIDMVIPIGLMKAGREKDVQADIAAVASAAHRSDAILKVIIEAVLLTDAQKERACLLSRDAGAEFVKTSTGFSTGGATVHDVTLMRRVVGPGMGVKAAGGIRTRTDALAMVEAGATRIGASASLAIVNP